jgi:hypothetical protein
MRQLRQMADLLRGLFAIRDALGLHLRRRPRAALAVDQAFAGHLLAFPPKQTWGPSVKPN